MMHVHAYVHMHIRMYTCIVCTWCGHGLQVKERTVQADRRVCLAGNGLVGQKGGVIVSIVCMWCGYALMSVASGS